MNRCVRFFIGLYSAFFVQMVIGAANKQQPEKHLTTMQSIGVGATVATGEIVCGGHLWSYGMNRAIARLPFKFKESYRGIGANIAGAAPVCAAQIVVSNKLSESIQAHQAGNLSVAQKAAIAYVAGVAGSLIDTPCNAVQLYMQNQATAGKGMIASCKALGRNSMRGGVANSFKEGIFTVGYQLAVGQTEKVARNYIANEYAAKTVGGVTAGVLTALITQPFAVVRNKMQADLFKQYYDMNYPRQPMPTMLSTCKTLYAREGAKGFYAGGMCRAGRIACALPFYAAASGYLKDKIV